MQWPLLATKFHRPIMPSKQVRRPHLFERLNEGLDSGRLLTLVSAPAGFGKTNCVVEWINTLDRPIAWLSLDPSDDDPGRFFSYFTAALQQIDARLGREIEASLNIGQLPPVDSISTAFINDIQSIDRAFLFVMDDFHVVQERVILQVLEKIIANQPPQLHFVLVTREDPLLPLARMRANNLMTEIRAADLRFSIGEIDRFLQEVMDLPLSAADISALENRTEGWVAGLQLAGLSMRGRQDPSSFISSLSGSHRYILSYLTEEVLSRQTEEVHSFLLQTSILDKLNGELCDAVTGRSDSGSLLERLFHANLFLISLDDDQRWYRYHHLFADLLRTLLNRTPGDTMIALHQRAAQWYAGAGMVSEAVEHALAAENYRLAVDLIEQHAMSIIMQGYIKTVERWFQAVPAAWHLKSPRANLALAGMYLMRGNYSMVGQYLQQAEKSLLSDEFAAGSTPQERDTLRSERLALQANLYNVQGQAAESLAAAQQALQSAQPGDYYIRGIAYLGLGGAYRLMDDYPRLVEAYQKAIQNSRAGGNSLSEMLSATALVLMAIQHGQLHFADDAASQVINRIDATGGLPPPVAGSIYGTLGMLQYEWNQLEAARVLYLRGLQLSQQGGHNAGVVFARVLLSRLYQAQGDLSAAAREIQEAVDLLPLGVPAWLKPEVILQQVRMDLARENLASAEIILNTLGIAWLDPIHRPTEQYYLAYLEWMLAQARGKTGSVDSHMGISVANHLAEGARQGERTSIALQALLLRARMQLVLNNRQSALEDLSLALDLAEPEGYMRSFIDAGADIALLLQDRLASGQHAAYTHRILAAWEGTHPGAVERTVVAAGETPAAPSEQRALPEPLTDRELEVLRLIAEGLKYEQIAEKLVISVNTVRFYIKEIYSKLQVNSRGQAVEAARRLRLL